MFSSQFLELPFLLLTYFDSNLVPRYRIIFINDPETTTTLHMLT